MTLTIIEESKIEKYVSELEQTNMQQTLRGKYELEFLRKIIDDLKNKHKKENIFQKNTNV